MMGEHPEVLRWTDGRGMLTPVISWRGQSTEITATVSNQATLDNEKTKSNVCTNSKKPYTMNLKNSTGLILRAGKYLTNPHICHMAAVFKYINIHYEILAQ